MISFTEVSKTNNNLAKFVIVMLFKYLTNQCSNYVVYPSHWLRKSHVLEKLRLVVF